MKPEKTYFFLIISLILLMNILCIKRNCDSEDACPADSTCCMTSSGPKCLPLIKGVCCIDGSKACPSGTYCIAKLGNECIS